MPHIAMSIILYYPTRNLIRRFLFLFLCCSVHNHAQSQAILEQQAVFEDLIQAPEVALRHKDGYTFQYYQNDIIQRRKTLLDNYMGEDNHLLWGTEYTFAEANPPENPLSNGGESNARRDEPYFSGAHPEYRRYTDYTNALHVAAQYAFLFTQDPYKGESVTINGVTKLAEEWAVDIAMKVLIDLHETVTDDDLDIWNGTYRSNTTWGTATRYVKGVHFKPINPYFVSISKASAMWDSFALISQVVSENEDFLSKQLIIYDWLTELGDFVDAALDMEFEYYVEDWRDFDNYEQSFKNGSISGLSAYSQNRYYYDANGNGVGGKIHAAADVGNNRNMGHLEYLVKTATYGQNNTLKQKTKDHLRRVYEVATSAEGGNVDIQRNNGPNFTELNYTWIALSEIAMIAQHHANYTLNSGNKDGWDEFYSLTHTEGVEDRFPSLDDSYATGNQGKSLKLMLDYQAGFLDNRTRYAFDGELLTMDNGTGTVLWRSFQMFDGNQKTINNYLDRFNNDALYDTSLWGNNEGLMSWHKWETIFGGPFSIVDFPNLYKNAADLRGDSTDSDSDSDSEIPVIENFYPTDNAATPSPNEVNNIGTWTGAEGGLTVVDDASNGEVAIHLDQVGVGEQFKSSSIIINGLKSGDVCTYSWDIKSNNSNVFFVTMEGGLQGQDKIYDTNSTNTYENFTGTFTVTQDNPQLQIVSEQDGFGNGGTIDNIIIEVSDTAQEQGEEDQSDDSQGEVGSIEAFFYKTVVYPNPLQGEVLSVRTTEYLNTEIGVGLYDMGGKEILLEQKNTDEEGEINLDLGFLMAGMYFLNIWDIKKGKIVASKKIIKL